MPYVGLKRRADFVRIQQEGRRLRGKQLLLIVDRNTVERQALSKERTTRGLCGLTITKKVGNAVTRNKIRRRLKAALRSLLFSAPTNWPSMVIIVFPKAATLGFGELYSNLAAVLRQAGLPL